MSLLHKYTLPVVAATLVMGCGDGDRTTQRAEYAPQMYVSIPYEPISQVEPNRYNPNGTNERTPPQGTVPRRSWAADESGSMVSDIMVYNLGPDDIEEAELLKNPVPLNEQTLANGKTLYLRYCSACHGEEGNGQGKVAAQYKGVPSYNAGAVKNLSEGHIYHVITWGIRRMWPHGTQMNPQERWEIVHYVQTLQQK